jgi:hypothetical protein
LNVVPASLEAAAFTRATRTERERCGARPAVCDRCIGVLEADDEQLVCPSCRRRFRVEDLVPCPREATACVTDADGAEDRLCASHAVLWHRLAGGSCRDYLPALQGA